MSAKAQMFLIFIKISSKSHLTPTPYTSRSKLYPAEISSLRSFREKKFKLNLSLDVLIKNKKCVCVEMSMWVFCLLLSLSLLLFACRFLCQRWYSSGIVGEKEMNEKQKCIFLTSQENSYPFIPLYFFIFPSSLPYFVHIVRTETAFPISFHKS